MRTARSASAFSCPRALPQRAAAPRHRLPRSKIAREAGVAPGTVAALEDQSRRALALLIRQQFHPGPTHLFADPLAVEGAFPATGVDWSLRIDYAQHAGCAMIRWLSIQ